MIKITDTVPLPLRKDRNGVIRIGNTRVTLDVVAASYDAGSSPEEIVCQYPSLDLADVYAVISYCLAHKSEIHRLLDSRRAKEMALKARIMSKSSP